MLGFYHTWHRPAESDILVTNWIPGKLTKALFMWRKLVPSRSVTRPSKLPWANQNLPVHSHDKKLARLASPVFDGRVTLLHVDTVARSAGSTRSRRDNHSMHKRCCQPLARAIQYRAKHYKRSLKFTRLWGWPSFPGQLFYFSSNR